MDVDTEPPASTIKNGTSNGNVSRDTTSPFLIRTFVKIGSFHRLSLFEDGVLPTTDEHQIFTWRDATLREVLSTLRLTSPHVAEFKHPLARFSFKAVYVDSSSFGHGPGAHNNHSNQNSNGRFKFASKDLGMVYSRDILGEPGSLKVIAPRLLTDELSVAEGGGVRSSSGAGDATVEGPGEGEKNPEITEREKEERTLDQLKFVPGDYLIVSVILPKGATTGTSTAPATGELSIKGSGGAAAATSVGWRSGNASAVGAGAAAGGVGGGQQRGANTGHWRGDSSGVRGRGFGRGGGRETRDSHRDLRDARERTDRDRNVDRDRDRDFRDKDRERDVRDRDRRPPPPRRNSPVRRHSPPPRRRDDSPPRNPGWGARGRGRGRGGRGGGDRGDRDRDRGRSVSRSRSRSLGRSRSRSIGRDRVRSRSPVRGGRRGRYDKAV